MSLVRHLVAVVVLPGTVAVLVPATLLDGAGAASAPLVLAGGALVGAGVALWAWTVVLFARVGRGTLAPWDPPRRLVVAGPYRHVRNPMIGAVLAVLVGEALIFGSSAVLAWAVGAFLLNWAWFALYEEPGLERRFGDEYREYRRRVPRWIPSRP